VWTFRVLGLRGVKVGLFCEDYPTLRDRHLGYIEATFPKWLGRLVKGETRDFVLHDGYGGGVLALRNLDDPSKYFSTEFAAIAVDELCRNSLSVFNDLRFRLRWPGISNTKFAAGTNPIGKGKAWVRKYWIRKQLPPEMAVYRDEFAVVPAYASDNPHLPPSYYDDLLTLPPDMARAVALGDWEGDASTYFPQFEMRFDEAQNRWISSPGRHVITAAEARDRIKPWHKRWISGDWGYYLPATFHWHSIDEHGRVITYRELWGRQVSEKLWGKKVGLASGTERLQGFPFSWDAGRLSPRSPAKYPRSIIDLLRDGLPAEHVKPHPADSSPGSRISGWRLMGQLLDSEMWQITDDCPHLIECLPTLNREEDNEEDVEKVTYAENTVGDDPADSARMGLQYMLATPAKPKEEVLEERMRELRRQYAAKAQTADLGMRDPFAAFGGKKL
jgi:hypothetical protein